MKNIYLITVFTVFFLICTDGLLQAQNTQTTLNQVELMKQFVGSWKCDMGMDSALFVDVKSYGTTGLEGNVRIVINGKTVQESKILMGYDKSADKYFLAEMVKGNDLHILSRRFLSSDNYEITQYDLSNPKKVSWKCEGVFITPDMFAETTMTENKEPKTVTYIRTRK